MRYPLLLAALIGQFAFTSAASANDPEAIVLEGEAPDDDLDHFRLPFEVPEGIREIAVFHESLSDKNILDWGLDDPSGFRGWGGGNREPIVVGEEASSRSYLIGPVAAGTWNVVVGKAQIKDLPAQYRVRIELRTEPSLSPQSERRPYEPIAALEEGPRYYAGDFHVHSRESGDARPTIDEVLTVAKAAGLDFIELAEHNTVSQLDFYGDAQARYPDILLIPGVEFTTYAGHANGIGATRFVDHKIGQPGVTIEGAARAFREQGALFSLNHPALAIGDLCIGCAWAHELSPELIDAIEIGTGGWNQGGKLFTPKVIEAWEGFVRGGYRVAPIGGSDDHDAGEGRSPIGSPTTLVFADELSVEAIVDGVRRGRTVVKLQSPEDPMIELEIGNELPGAKVRGMKIPLRAVVKGGEGAELRIVESGEAWQSVEIHSDPFVYEATVEPPLSGEAFVRAEVLVNNEPRTITNHLYLERAEGRFDEAEEAEDAGCGCRIRPSRGSPWPLAFLATLLFMRRRRRA